jgi:hypothetical protein
MIPLIFAEKTHLSLAAVPDYAVVDEKPLGAVKAVVP